MKVEVETMKDGTIVCETETANRHYRSRYRGYSLKEAKVAFEKRVLVAEQEELDKARLLSLAQYLKVKE